MNLRAVVLSAIGGYAAEGLEAVLERCRKLAADLNDDARLFSAVRALWYLHGKRGEVDATWALVDELRRLSTRLDHRRSVLADVSAGTTALWAGNLETARESLGARRGRGGRRPLGGVRRGGGLRRGSSHRGRCQISRMRSGCSETLAVPARFGKPQWPPRNGSNTRSRSPWSSSTRRSRAGSAAMPRRRTPCVAAGSSSGPSTALEEASDLFTLFRGAALVQMGPNRRGPAAGARGLREVRRHGGTPRVPDVRGVCRFLPSGRSNHGGPRRRRAGTRSRSIDARSHVRRRAVAAEGCPPPRAW